ncbi:MAG: transglutaminase-like domain-containing protein [Oscillospiraceae bacterium]|nr:transglutaminase-like domain-containing protein [Oscillospiraceae bacterium]
MKRLMCFVFLLVLVISASGSAVHAQVSVEPIAVALPVAEKKILYTGSKSEIDASHKDMGYVTIRYLQATSKKLKIKITRLKSDGSEETSYIYDLSNKPKKETYSMSQGNGRYQIKVLENIEGDRYAVVQNQNIDITLKSKYDPFLAPIQYINYTSTSKAVVKAKALVKDRKTEYDKLRVIYRYIVTNYVYDYNKADKVVKGQLNGYVPALDTIYNSKKGICFDYSSLLAAMLRSVGIPTKLVMGYVAPNNAYHAWNEVYIKDKGWIKINSQIYFDGKNYSRMDSTFAAANKSGKQTAFIGNGKNYAPVYQY